jgi:hypothetical protein
MDGHKVPLLWQHGHDNPENVLGHVFLEARDDGMYAKAFFNQTPKGQNAKLLVMHEDITAMSIYANQLVEKSKSVLHGMIREVSLVLSGANPGALIDQVRISHSSDPDDISVLEDEAVIYTGLKIEHAAVDSNVFDKATQGGELEHRTVQEIIDSFDEEQMGVFSHMIAEALQAGKDSAAEHSADSKSEDPKTDDADDKNDEGNLEPMEGSGEVKHRNIFEKGADEDAQARTGSVLSHSDLMEVMERAQGSKSTFQTLLKEKALQHGITDIELLFPDARSIKDRPDFLQRRVEWVEKVLGAVSKTPFAKIKHLWADLTLDEARAKGYIKGEFKKEEWFGIAKRTTAPTTIYKKQKFDRDDIIDITDFDVIAWVWGEMEMMLKEELARAILIGDGRAVDHDDKIKDPVGATDGTGIRSIANDDEMFAPIVYVNLGDSSSSYMEVLDALTLARRFYKGTGLPTFYTTEEHLAQFLLLRDESTSNRRLFNSVGELATAMRVKEIVTVEPMETVTDLVGIVTNLSDYNLGTNKGGELTRFDDFDIDYNQYKYLLETRLSGALVELKSALVIKKTASANVLVAPTKPSFVSSTGVITIPTQTGVVYKDGSASGSTLTAGAQTALAAGASKTVVAVPASGYYFATTEQDSWTFTRDAA